MMNSANFFSKNIVVLDTCVCRSLSRSSESAWVSDFCKMKKDISFCLSDIAVIELLNQFNSESISEQEWNSIIEKISTFIFDDFPVVPGGSQLFNMVLNNNLSKDVSFKEEQRFSKKIFNFLKNCKQKEDLNKYPDDKNGNSLKFDKILCVLQTERDSWINCINELSANNSSRTLEERINDFNNSEPTHTLGQRMDLLIKHLYSIENRAKKNIESYNPKSKKKKNDGIDILMLFALIIPARICTIDSLNGIKQINSFQAKWIMTPDELVKTWREDRLNHLRYPIC